MTTAFYNDKDEMDYNISPCCSLGKPLANGQGFLIYEGRQPVKTPYESSREARQKILSKPA